MNLLNLHSLVDVAVSILPVFVFLSSLVFLDSYKLVSLRSIVFTIIVGCFAAGLSYYLNGGAMQSLHFEATRYSRYGGPVVEEIMKAAYVMYLFRARRVGFMVDAAIYGFALGAGFAFVENIYYLQSLAPTNVVLWTIRGFGTAVMHGGATALFAITSKTFTERNASEPLYLFIPALLLAIAIHSTFNHFFFSPVASTLGIIIVLPLLFIAIFNRSEQATREWLGVGFDTDQELLQMITAGNVSKSKIGEYLSTLQSKFSGELVVDMLCYLRIYLELSIQAKGILLMREAGFDVPPNETVKASFEELGYLEKSIGTTGKFALKPIVNFNSRDLWQFHMLQKH